MDTRGAHSEETGRADRRPHVATAPEEATGWTERELRILQDVEAWHAGRLETVSLDELEKILDLGD